MKAQYSSKNTALKEQLRSLYAQLNSTRSHYLERKLALIKKCEKDIKPSIPLVEKLQRIAEARIAANAERIRIQVQRKLEEHLMQINNEISKRIDQEKTAIKLECSREVKMEGESKERVKAIREEIEKLLYEKIHAQLEPVIRENLRAKIIKEIEARNKAIIEAKIREYTKHAKLIYEEKLLIIKKRQNDINKRSSNELITEKENHMKKINQGLYEQDTTTLEKNIFAEYEQKFTAELEHIERDRIELISQKAVHAKKIKDTENNMKQAMRVLQRKELELVRDEINLEARNTTPSGLIAPVCTSIQRSQTPLSRAKNQKIVPLSEGQGKKMPQHILPNSRQIIDRAIEGISLDDIVSSTKKNISPNKAISSFLISSPNDVNEFTDY